MQNTETTIQLRQWTVEEYHRMAEAGIFGADERVERSLPASTRTVGGTLSTGTTRVTHGDMCRKPVQKAFLLIVSLLGSHWLWSLSYACGTLIKRQENQLVGVSSAGTPST